MNTMAEPAASSPTLSPDPPNRTGRPLTKNTATPRCGRCNKPLDVGVDKQRSTDRFWRNCKECRDKHTSERRRAKGLPPKGEPQKFVPSKRKRPVKKTEMEDHSINSDTHDNVPCSSDIERTREKSSSTERLEVMDEQRLRMMEGFQQLITDWDDTDDELDAFSDGREGVVEPSMGPLKQESLKNKLPKKKGIFRRPESDVSQHPFRTAEVDEDISRHRVNTDTTDEELVKRLPEKTQLPNTKQEDLNFFAGQRSLLDSDADGHLRQPGDNGDAPYTALKESEGTCGKRLGTLGNEGSMFPRYLPNPTPEFLGDPPPKPNVDEARPKEALDWNLDSDNDIGSDPLPTSKDLDISVVEPDLPSELSSTTSTAEEPVAEDRECSVCAEAFPIQDFPSLIACSHEPSVCHECFLAWLDQRMASTTWEQIVCPSSGCSTIVGHDDVKSYAPVDVFTRFDELSMRSFLSNDPSFFYCPAEACTSGQIYDTSSAGNIFRCNACGFRVCTHHTPHVPWHVNETCTQFDDRVARERAAKAEEERIKREAEEASIAEVGRSSVECPGCGANIHKTSGCDHMTCRRAGCRFQFCYVCRAPYDGERGIMRVGNAAHQGSCKYHSKKLPSFQGDVPVEV